MSRIQNEELISYLKSESTIKAIQLSHNQLQTEKKLDIKAAAGRDWALVYENLERSAEQTSTADVLAPTIYMYTQIN